MFTALITFFTSSIGKYAGYALILGSLVAFAYGYVKTKENAAVASATAAYNAAQLQQALKENQTYQAEIASLTTYEDSLRTQITTLQGTIESLTQKAQTNINQSNFGTTLDPIFPETLNILKGTK